MKHIYTTPRIHLGGKNDLCSSVECYTTELYVQLDVQVGGSGCVGVHMLG